MDQIEKLVSAGYIRKRTIGSLLVFFVFLFACFFSWRWLHEQPREEGALRPLRKVLNANEVIFGSLYSTTHFSKQFPVSRAALKVRPNGSYGIRTAVDTTNWRLQLVRKPGDTLLISLDDIKRLPKTDVIFDFKCIEGWSQITHWGGVRFSDFAKFYGLSEQTDMQFTGLVTPDKEYYVGIDNRSMMHTQTILCYEMNGAPLPMNQGYPLRLIIPVKYGVKHLKRIGTMFFSNTRPRDYWYEQGYDYYCGL